MSHSKGPWAYGEDNDSWYVEITGSDKQLGWGFSQDDARRVVACVNACAGVSADFLEGFAHGVNIGGEPLDKLLERANAQRDALLAALERLCDRLPKGDVLNYYCAKQELVAARAAIAQFEKTS